MFSLDIKILIEGAKPFQKGRKGDVGYDIWSLHDAIIPPLTSAYLKTGIATAFPEGWVGLILDRSGMGWKGSIKRAGVIDPNWRGEWQVCLFNSAAEALLIEGCLKNPQAKACAQVVFLPCADEEPRIVTELPESVRGNQWRGSSDVCDSSKR